jgi:hypothetical protein
MNKHFHDIEEVKDFFRYLVNDRKVAIHPDDNFRDYINTETQKPAFTDYEANLFNAMMDDCFEVCQDEEKDIYEIAYHIMHKEDIQPYWDELERLRSDAKDLLQGRLVYKGFYQWDDDNQPYLMIDKYLVSVSTDGTMVTRTEGGREEEGEWGDLPIEDIVLIAQSINDDLSC